PRADNQDFGGVHLGSPSEQRTHGVVAIVADGVSGSKGGRIAAELAVRSFIDGYMDQDPIVGIPTAGIRAMQGYNRWLNSKGKTDPNMQGAACTFTAMVLRGREATVLHVGDSRAWHFRDGVLTRLTQDHVHDQPGKGHVLIRALGIEQDVKMDVRSTPLMPHDRLLLTSDGVHGVLSEEDICRILGRRGSADADAQGLLDAVTVTGPRDNATALVVDVVTTGALDWEALGAEVAGLPILPPPGAGQDIDGYHLDRLLSDGRYTRVFLARDGSKPGLLVLKFPKPAILSEKGARSAFLRESFIGRRVDSPYVGRTLTPEAGRQTQLYLVQPYYEGRTLHARLTHEPMEMAGAVTTALNLARAVSALHRLGVAHRDIKPDNVILEKDGGLKLIDLGVARIPRLEEEFDQAEAPGTPGYMAPELFDGAPGDAASDQFALGVTLFRALTGPHYPWAKAEEEGRPKFEQRPTSLTRLRPDVPSWLEAAIRRTLQVDPDDRFADVDELVHVLESGERLAAPQREPLGLIERHPVRFWQGLCLFLLVCLLVSLSTR
ncbi:MAG: bifunctional protein-serine/threonine kinase/phosphatase, partial [Brevundimonas sp.]